MGYNTNTSFKTESCIFNLPTDKLFQENLEIMIIDDSKKDIALFETILKESKDLDFSLFKFSKPSEALNALKSNNINLPNLIVLDLNMPAINGFMMLQEIQQLLADKNIPIVIHSSMSDYKNKMKIHNMKADAFFAKPLDVKLFKSFIYGTIN